MEQFIPQPHVYILNEDTITVDTSTPRRYYSLMSPIRPDHHDFVFDPNSLTSLRKQIRMTQAVLAEQLDVPVNTVSRWETGATTPDAKALAAIYSIARASGVTAQFFKRRPNLQHPQNQRTRLLYVWDLQNLGIRSSELEVEWPFIRDYLNLRFPGTRDNLQCSAYARFDQAQAVQELQRIGFRVYQGFFDADLQIVNDIQAACQDRPEDTVLVLVTNDGDYADLFTHLKRAGVEVYVLGTAECSERLRKSVGREGFIHWDAPFVVTECVEVIKEIDEDPISKAEFGNRCKIHLDEDGIYPDDVGFSRRNPYGSILRWLELQGIVNMAKVPGKRDLISIRLVSAATRVGVGR